MQYIFYFINLYMGLNLKYQKKGDQEF